MIISIIVAASDNNVIGKDNQLLWHLPADMKFFKNSTWALPIIMGRKTFESLGKPLMGRVNIVMTRQNVNYGEDVIVASDIEEALKKAQSFKTNEIFIIGGGEVYKQAFPFCNRIYMTRVHTVIEGDTYFPEINPKDDFSLIKTNSFAKDDKNPYDYTFELWERLL